VYANLTIFLGDTKEKVGVKHRK